VKGGADEGFEAGFKQQGAEVRLVGLGEAVVAGVESVSVLYQRFTVGFRLRSTLICCVLGGLCPAG
jgi:hypothetical protein